MTPTALLVDDDDDIRLMTRLQFRVKAPDIEILDEAVDGHDAVAKWRGLNPPPHPSIVVLDQRMPGMDGIDVARHILAEHPDQAIVLYSAHLDDDLRDRAAEIGIGACVDKTASDNLIPTIRALLSDASPAA